MRCVLALLLMAVTAQSQVALPTMPTWMSAETEYNGTGLDVGDIDGDGWLDLAISNGNDITQSPNLVYHNDHGTLPEAATWTSQDERYSGHCQLADLDGDGLPELMVSNYITPGWGPAQVQVYKNVDGVLETWPSWESPDNIYSFRATFGDPDQDGDLDLAVATGEAYHSEYEANLIFFNVDGTLEDTPGWSSTVDDACYDAKFVDIDQDGDQDLAFCGGGTSGRITIYRNNDGVIETSPFWTTAAADNGNTFDFDDLDGDGRCDLLVGFNDQLGGSGRFAAFLTNGGDLPTSPTWNSNFSGYGSAVVCADLDGVNGPDLVTGGWWERIRIYLNDGNGGFANEPDWETLEAWESVVENICLVDLDEGRSRLETVALPMGTSLFEIPHRHLQAVVSVTVGEQDLPLDAYSSSLRDGWISLADPAAFAGTVTYRVSDGLDLAISNWDDAVFVFHSLLPTAVTEPDLPTVTVAEMRAWPNPFNPTTRLAIRLPEAGTVSLSIYDVTGRKVSTLVDGHLGAGEHTVNWSGQESASGVYLARLKVGETVLTRKLSLVK